MVMSKGQASKIEQLRKILEGHQAARVDGIFVDAFSASAIVQIYDKLSPENQQRYEAMSLVKMSDIAFKIINKHSR